MCERERDGKSEAAVCVHMCEEQGSLSVKTSGSDTKESESAQSAQMVAPPSLLKTSYLLVDEFKLVFRFLRGFTVRVWLL